MEYLVAGSLYFMYQRRGQADGFRRTKNGKEVHHSFNIAKLDLLISLYIACICVSELMGAKTFPIVAAGPLNLNASVAIFVVPLVYSINDTMTEVYGRARAQSLVRSGLLVIAFLLGFSLLAVHLPATSRFSPTEPSYGAVFNFSARIAAASLIAFGIGQFADVLIFANLRQHLGRQALWLRTNVSNFLAHFLDTTLFLTLAFYATGQSLGSNISFLLGLILPYWFLKCCMSVIETPLVYLGVEWLRHPAPAAA